MSQNKLIALLDSEGITEDCEECHYFEVFTQSHPYGSTTATETIVDCKASSDDQCPRLSKEN